MGGEDSKPQPAPIVQSQSQVQEQPVAEQDTQIYILHKISQMSLNSQNRQLHYWIDPRIFNSQNQKYLNYLNKIAQVQGCSSIEGFMNELANIQPSKKVKTICAASLQDDQYKILQNQNRVKTIYLFCQNKERAKLLMSNIPKIKAAKFTIEELKQFLVQEQNSSDAFDSKSNILLTVQEDTNLMNKYRINFHSLINSKNKEKAKNDFIQFAKQSYPQYIKQINQFESNYKLNLAPGESNRQAVFWLSQPGFFWESTQGFPKITTDPKKLAYLRFPFKEGYEGILKQYKSNPQYLSQVFITVTPSYDQLEKMKNNVDNFLIFTTFVKGYTTQKKAKQALKKTPNSFLVRVMMKLPPQIHQNLDFGYKVISNNIVANPDDPDVVFNIYNVFQIIEFEQDLRQFTFQYGSLAQVSYIRQKERTKRLSLFQQNLLRNYDYLQDIVSRIDSQATILQMSGHFEDSLLIHSQRLQQIRKSQPSQQVLDRYTIQLGDAFKMNEQYKNAQEQYLSIKDGPIALRAKVHLAELYFKTKQTEKLSKIIQFIEMNLGKYKQISEPDSFKAQNYIGMELMNRGKYRQANKLYKSLAADVNKFYDYKFQGIPLVHQICRNRAACETKLNNFTQALNLLDSTKGWQKICQGNKSPGLIITENLIRSVHQSRGQIKEAQICESQMQKIKRSTSRDQNLYLSRSGVFINLNQSVINIQTSSLSQGPTKQQFKQEPPKRIIEQSVLNIQL